MLRFLGGRGRTRRVATPVARATAAPSRRLAAGQARTPQAERRREYSRQYYARNRERILERRRRARQQARADGGGGGGPHAASGTAAKKEPFTARQAARLLIVHRPDSVAVHRPVSEGLPHTMVLSARSAAHMWQIADPLVRLVAEGGCAAAPSVMRVEGRSVPGGEYLVLDLGALVVHLYTEASPELVAMLGTLAEFRLDSRAPADDIPDVAVTKCGVIAKGVRVPGGL